MTAELGATAGEWFHFDFVLGLGANLLPCVPASSDVRVLKGSALAGKVGKIPSQFNREGEAHGLKEWQKREILGNEVVSWSSDRRLNLCVRTGSISGVYAIDCDVDETQLSDAVEMKVLGALPGCPKRSRDNSVKWLRPFRLADGACKKRIIKTGHGRIELLAEGQQFVAAGTHASGVRYRWLPGLPDTIPTLTLAQLNQLWDALDQLFGDGRLGAATQPVAADTKEAPTDFGPILTQISDEDWSGLIEALRFLVPHAASNDLWSEIGYGLLSITNKPAQQLWCDFSKLAPGYQEGAPEAWWESHRTQTPRTDYRHIFTLARKRGYARVADPALFAPVVPPDGADAAPLNVVPEVPQLARIQLTQGSYAQLIDQLETLLVPEVFVQGPKLVRRAPAHDDADIVRDSDALMLVEVTKEWLMKRTGELAVWERWLKTDGAWSTVDPVDQYLSGLLRLNSWTRLRPLDALARAPFVRSDGTVCDSPGYDARSRVLYVPAGNFPPVADAPSREEALAALARIREVFDQFPWKEPASESAFLAHILSEAARLAIDRCPMFFYDAPAPGTGKSLLQEMAARVVHGTDVAVRPWVASGDEIRKVLYSALLAGDRSMWFDNIPDGTKIRSSELCGFLTSETWTDRKLGESSSLGIPNKMVLVGSGNNITPSGDLARRSLVIRMDANTEDLKQRVFKIPLLRSYVMEHRPQLLVDALTIIKAYHTATDVGPMPPQVQSFERWSHFCREPLIWLGLPDPVITQNETDDGHQATAHIFTALYERFGGSPFTSLDIARLVNGISDANGELAASMQQNGCAEPNSPLKVGYWLRGCRDRISNGLKLVHAGSVKSGVQWRFQQVGEDLVG